ncbi:MAG: hypothetical protein IRY94_20440, partial [Rhodospirillaceae bacterium]|nr:hypothetical protein [Rhodospirillaceae bacterium]
LTLALVARAGCFFVLPFVVLWVGWLCRCDHRRLSLRASAGAGAAVGLGFAFNWAVLHAFGVPGSAFSNFPMSLYGVISGGDWTTAYADHPEIRAMPEAQAAQRLLSVILARLHEDPWLLVEGSFRAWAAFLGFKVGQFSFLRAGALAQIPEMTRVLVPWAQLPTGLARITGALGVHDWPTLVVVGTYSLTPWLLFAAGAAVAAADARNPRNRLLAACWAGIVASIPFVPPWDADLMRAYAATLPLQFVLCGLGASRAVAWLTAPVARRRVEGRPAGSADPIAARTIALATVAALLPVLLVFKVATWNAAPDPVATHACAAGRPHLVLPIAGAEITLADRREGLFRLDVAGFKRSLPLLLKSFPELFRPFMALPPGTTLTAVRYADGFGYGVLAHPAGGAVRSGPDRPIPVCVDSPLLIDMSHGPGAGR